MEREEKKRILSKQLIVHIIAGVIMLISFAVVLYMSIREIKHYEVYYEYVQNLGFYFFILLGNYLFIYYDMSHKVNIFVYANICLMLGFVLKLVYMMMIYIKYYGLDIGFVFEYPFLVWGTIVELLVIKHIIKKKIGNDEHILTIFLIVLDILVTGIIGGRVLYYFVTEPIKANIAQLAYVTLFLLKYLRLYELDKADYME